MLPLALFVCPEVKVICLKKKKNLDAFIKLQSEARKMIKKDRGVMFAVYLSPSSHCVGEITWNLSCVIRSG